MLHRNTESQNVSHGIAIMIMSLGIGWSVFELHRQHPLKKFFFILIKCVHLSSLGKFSQSKISVLQAMCEMVFAVLLSKPSSATSKIIQSKQVSLFLCPRAFVRHVSK
jgi:hypothetical protein